MSVTINVTRDGGTPAIQHLLGQLTPQRLAGAVGPACARLFKRNFIGLGTNKRGWTTTNFWARAAKATSWSREPEGVMVSCNLVGVRQRLMGGTIRPVSARALTIPMSPVSYGHSAREFPGSFVLKTDSGSYIVQASEGRAKGETKKDFGGRLKLLRQGGNNKARTAGRLEFLFKLVSSVTQAADPGVIPARDLINATARQAIVEALGGKGGVSA